jgi:hypothetical protein
MSASAGGHTRSSAVERAASIALRTAHLAAVIALGAALLGAPVPVPGSGLAVVGSGALLFAMELFARRMHVLDIAGLAVLAKLLAAVAVSAWPALQGTAGAAFWILVVLSSLSSHAPKGVRHWRPF